MALCEQCGSIQVVRVEMDRLDKVVAILSSRRPFGCRRCGWRGRRNWTDEDLQRLQNYGLGGAEPDSALVVLDRRMAPSDEHPEPDSAQQSIDLSVLDRDGATPTDPIAEPLLRMQLDRPQFSRRRRRNSVPSGVAAILAAVMFCAFAFLLLAMTDSCR